MSYKDLMNYAYNEMIQIKPGTNEEAFGMHLASPSLEQLTQAVAVCVASGIGTIYIWTNKEGRS